MKNRIPLIKKVLKNKMDIKKAMKEKDENQKQLKSRYISRYPDILNKFIVIKILQPKNIKN